MRKGRKRRERRERKRRNRKLIEMRDANESKKEEEEQKIALNETFGVFTLLVLVIVVWWHPLPCISTAVLYDRAAASSYSSSSFSSYRSY